MKILLFGDICPTEDYLPLFDDGATLFGAFAEQIASADAVICNLECPATTADSAIEKCGPSLRARPEHIPMLKRVGFTAFAAANNHILDYGEQGLSDMISLCRTENVTLFGAGITAQAASEPLRLTASDGSKVTVFAFAEEEFNLAGQNCGGAVGFDPYVAYDRIREAKSEGRVIVLYHGGIEYYRLPSPLLKKKCEKMVDCGADLVLCQHSHVIGTIETRGNATIVYGQGNSVFGYRKGSDSWNEGLLVCYDSETNAVSYELIQAKPDCIMCAEDAIRDARLKEIETASAAISDDSELRKAWEVFCVKNAPSYYALLYGRGRVFNRLNRLLNGKLLDFFYRRKKKMITMNLLRCDAHREVCKTILERDFYG